MKTTNNFDFLKIVRDVRKEIPDELYEQLKECFGVEKSNEIVERDIQAIFYKVLKLFIEIQKALIASLKSDGLAFEAQFVPQYMEQQGHWRLKVNTFARDIDEIENHILPLKGKNVLVTVKPLEGKTR